MRLVLGGLNLAVTALCGSLEQDLSSLPRNQTWATEVKTRNPTTRPPGASG